MWYIIETGLGLKIPAYLKNIMRLEGYDTSIVIKNMTTDTFEELEHFGRTKMFKFIKKDEKITILTNIIFVPVSSKFQPDIKYYSVKYRNSLLTSFPRIKYISRPSQDLKNLKVNVKN